MSIKNKFKNIMVGALVMSMGMNGIVAYGQDRENEDKTYAFNTEIGKIDVNYEEFLSKHDLVYLSQPKQSFEAMPIANGRVGAMVWGDNKIQMEIMNVDASPHTALSQARVTLQSFPEFNATEFEQRLNLYNGNINLKYNEEVHMEIFGVPGSELIGIKVSDERINKENIYFDIEVWPVPENLKENVGTQDIEPWGRCEVFEDKTNEIVGITKGISEIEPFGYTFATKVIGADTQVQVKDESNIRIYIEPIADEYTIYMSTASVLNASNQDSVAQAKKELVDICNRQVDEVINESKNWWHKYWEKSFVSYEDGNKDGDYHENIYYLYQYLFGGAAYGKYPMHFINGVYRYDKDQGIHWSNGYWHFNQRAVYNGALASNRIEAIMSYFNFYENIMKEMQIYTEDRFGFENGALKTTETVRWDGYPFKKSDLGGMHENDYVGWIYSTGPEVAANMYDLYRYTQDEEMLKRFYPYIEKTVEFIVQWARWDEQTGQYHLDESNSLENWWKINNATPDNAAIRNIIPKFLESYKILGKIHNQDLVDKARDVLEKLEPITKYKGENRYAPYDLYDKQVNITNVQNPELEIVYPHSITGIGYPDYETAVNTYWNRQVGQGISIWTVDGIQAARLGLGDEAARVLKQMQLRNQKLVCGITDDGNGLFESMGLHVSTINEMYLQSYDELIRVFPAVPTQKEFKGAFTLLATGGFLVSSEYADEEVKYIGLKSQYGGKAKVAIPWDIEYVWVNGSKVSVKDGVIVIDTEQGVSYLIENPNKSLDTMIKTVYSGVRNNGVKTLGNKVLGIDRMNQGDRSGEIVRYDFEQIVDNQIMDQTENEYHGKLAGNLVEAEGKTGKGIRFNGGRIEVKHPKLTLDDEFIVSLDIRPEQQGNYVILDKYGSNNTGFYIDVYGDRIRVIIGNNYNLTVPNTLEINEWNQIKVRYSTALGKLEIWVNDTLSGVVEIAKEIPYNDQALYIGAGRWNHQHFNGTMDNLEIKYIDLENEVPIAHADEYQILSGTELEVSRPGVLTNDWDEKMETVHVELIKSVDNGNLKFFGDGGFKYTPDKDFVGKDKFSYRVIDEKGNCSEENLVEIYVGIRTTASDDYFRGKINQKISGDVVKNDIGSEGLPIQKEYTVEVTTEPSNGKLDIEEYGEFIYTPRLGFVGKDEFTYIINKQGVASNVAKVTLEIIPDQEGVILNFEGEGNLIKDILGRDNDAEVAGSYNRIDTPYGKGIELVGGYIDIPYAENLKMEDKFELEITFKPNSDQYFNRLVSNYIDGEKGFLIDVGPYEGKQRIRIIGGEEIPGWSWQSNAEIKAGEWTTAKWVVNSEEGKASLYINGELDSERIISKPLVKTEQGLYIGKDPHGGSRMHVQIAQFKVLNLAEESKIIIKTEEQVEGNKVLEVEIAVGEIEEKIYAKDFIFKYDPELFDVVKIQGVGTKNNIIYKEENNGVIRILVATEGGLTQGEESVKIFLQAKRGSQEESIITMLVIEEVQLGLIEENNSIVKVVDGMGKKLVVEASDGEIDKSTLAQTIIEGKELSNQANIGNAIGEYPIGAKKVLDLAIQGAEQIYQASINQEEINQAVSDLKREMEVFRCSIVQENNPDSNEDGEINISDLALVAYYYRENSEGARWKQAKRVDFNYNGVIDIGDLTSIGEKILTIN